MSNYQIANTASEDVEKYRAHSNVARVISSRVEHNSSQFVAKWDNDLLDSMAGQQNETDQVIGYEEVSHRWTSGNAKDRMWVEENVDNFIKSQASHLLDLQNLDEWQEPSSKTIPDVKGQTEIELFADQNKEGITLERMNANVLF